MHSRSVFCQFLLVSSEAIWCVCRVEELLVINLLHVCTCVGRLFQNGSLEVAIA